MSESHKEILKNAFRNLTKNATADMMDTIRNQQYSFTHREGKRRLARLDNSVVFKKLFTDREVLQAFVKDLTGVTIEPDRIETEKSFAPPIGAIDIKMDIFAEDTAHRLIVEIQRVKYDYHYDRFLYYHNAAMMELQRTHTQYLLGKTVYTIVWLTAKDDTMPHDIVTTRFQSMASDGTDIPLYPHKLFFLNPNYRTDRTPDGIRDWLELVFESIAHPDAPHLNSARSIIRKATGLIESDGLTPTERRIIMEDQGYDEHLALRRRLFLPLPTCWTKKSSGCAGPNRSRNNLKNKGSDEPLAG